ncbi:Mannonate dehydratase [Raoultella ornithinolytica]|nr:Mannonate dehydratase [Raoultella ornithinolytica]
MSYISLSALAPRRIYSEEEQRQAQARFAAMSEADIEKLTRNIIAGLPGAEEGYTLEQFRARLAEYDHINKAQLRENMAVFLRAIVPVCEEVGVRLAVHPDDPPRPILGLPRIVSTIEDMQWLKDRGQHQQRLYDVHRFLRRACR